ncbi:hypothetical protein [Novipirellula rosea]|uniref:NrS-1 polymerase-like HBD domain-containing protein n=1 Tax=Novipirellula rosea TaxID=1031540 RepID=A0ABP8MTM9_9BACT
MTAAIQMKARNIPGQLRQYDQWVGWKYHSDISNGQDRKRKVPVNPKTGRFAKVTDRTTWTCFDEAVEFALSSKEQLEGVGFVFTDGDPFVGIDLDDVIDPVQLQIVHWAQSVLDSLDTYTEVSPSGTGVKAIATTDSPVRSRRRSSPGIEIYSSSRFFTITGSIIGANPEINNRTKELAVMADTYFPEPPSPQPQMVLDRVRQTVTDEEILDKATNSRNGSKFLQLWNGETKGHDGNQSQADLGLCRLLAFWCGPNDQQIDHLFRQSGLFRSKWDERHFSNGATYGTETIRKAILAQGDAFYRWPIPLNKPKPATSS